jgi:dTDP-glucose pyrophosphorylase/CBS domain-containing protein
MGMNMTDSISEKRIESVIISPSVSIGEAISRLDEAGTGALVLCTANRRLVGFLADGDIRRAILKGRSLSDSCDSIANGEPIVARWPIAPTDSLRLMNQHDINHLPVVNAEGILQDLILRRDLGLEVELDATTEQRLESVVISPTASISEAVEQLDRAGTGALVLCAQRALCGLLTDGDIRRAVLQGKSMSDPCSTVASLNPVVASQSISRREALNLMDQHDIHHLPLVDAKNNVIKFLLRKDLVAEGRSDLSAVIMAGGYGKRLLPLTESVPKPMLPVGDRPMLEHVIQQLRRSGIREVNMTTHYLPESISNHFGDGNGFGVRLNYVQEESPMGTAGGVKLMKRPEGSFVVVNGDILTGVPFHEMLMYHRKHKAEITVGVRKYEMQVPFGVVQCEDVHITGLQEKPSLSFFINAGTYLLEPSAYDSIPEGQPFDMTDLIKKLIDEGRTVVGFPIMEYWIDIGQPEDYKKVQEYAMNGRII